MGFGLSNVHDLHEEAYIVYLDITEAGYAPEGIGSEDADAFRTVHIVRLRVTSGGMRWRYQAVFHRVL